MDEFTKCVEVFKMLLESGDRGVLALDSFRRALANHGFDAESATVGGVIATVKRHMTEQE